MWGLVLGVGVWGYSRYMKPFPCVRLRLNDCAFVKNLSTLIPMMLIFWSV